jgi:formyltetrahydrofolate-dependent phosphoribosylglycinamide formyltransferase
MKKIVVFASGGGSNFKSIFNHLKKNKIDASIALLVSNNPKCKAIEFAESNGIETFVINKNRYPDSSEYEKIILEKLERFSPSLIVLAGYIKKIPIEVVRKFEGKIINIHPALLPKFGGKGFYGMKVHNSVIESGEKESGITVHFVNEDYDKGEIIVQERVPVLKDDTPESLAKRVLEIEHRVYPLVVEGLCAKNHNFKGI